MAATRTQPQLRAVPASYPEAEGPRAVPKGTAGRLPRVALIALNGFLGITAVAGGLGLLAGWIAPGEDSLEGSPFSSYVVPGLVLLIVVGGSALAAAAAALRRHALAAPASALAGLMIMAYETVEVAVIGFHWLQLAYVVLGVVIVALAARLWSAGRRLGPRRTA